MMTPAADDRSVAVGALRATIADLIDTSTHTDQVKGRLRSMTADATPEQLAGAIQEAGGWKLFAGQDGVDKGLQARVSTAYAWASGQPQWAREECCQPIAGRMTFPVTDPARMQGWATGLRPVLVDSAQTAKSIGSKPEVVLYTLTSGEKTEVPEWVRSMMSWGVPSRELADEAAEIPPDPDAIREKIFPILGPWRAILWALQASEFRILRVGLAWQEAHPGQREGDWLRWLAGWWIDDRLAPKAKADIEREDRRINSRELAVRHISRDPEGDRYVGLDRALEEGAALFGGPLVSVDGERYPQTPECLQRFQPRYGGILPESILKRRKNPMLPMMEIHRVAEFDSLAAVKAVGLGDDYPRITAKLVPLMFATCGGLNTLVTGTLGGLTDMLNPGRKTRARDRETVARALVAAGELRLIERLSNGVLKPHGLFVVDYQFSTAKDAEIGWSNNPFFLRRMKRGGGSGFYLVNIDGILRLDSQRPRVIALYLNQAGWWYTTCTQAGSYVDGRCRPRRLVDIAKEVNTLPPTALEYIDGKGDRRTMHQAIEEVRADIETLSAEGLIGSSKIDGKGRNAKAVIRPSDGYIEALRQAHNRHRK